MIISKESAANINKKPYAELTTTVPISFIHWQMAYWFDHEFRTDALANVCHETFEAVKSELHEYFIDADDFELSDEDIKCIWKQWFDIVLSDGTLPDSDGAYERACKAIDNL